MSEVLSLISALNNWTYVVSTDAASTPYGVTWDDGGTTITGTLVASASTEYKIYLVPITSNSNNYDEYITVKVGSTYSWEKFGSIGLPDLDNYVKNKSGHSGGTAGDLAYKDSVSASYTPAGSVTSSFSGTGVMIKGTVTASGSISSGAPASGQSGNYTPAGSISASFSGSSTTSTGKFTPSGSVTVSTNATENKTATVSAAGSGDATYTPAGSVAVSSAGSTTTVNSITAVGTLPNLTTTVADEVLTIGWSAGTLPTKGSDTTVKTGDASYSFTGTGARLVTGNIAVPSTYTASFSGTEGDVSVSGTPSGSITNASFTGAATQLSFTGSSANLSITTSAPGSGETANYTPDGSISSSFCGTAATITPT